MGSDNGDDLVTLEEALRQLAAEEVRTSTDVVVFDQIIAESVLVVYWIGPHQVAEESCLGDLAEAVDLLDVV